MARIEAVFQEVLYEHGKKQSAYDGDIQPSDVMNPDKGIVCPWNKDEHGPAKQRIVCLVWKNWDDFNDWGSEYNFHFCRQLCQYGRNPEQTRRRRELRDRLKAVPAWMKAMSGGVPPYRLPAWGRRP